MAGGNGTAAYGTRHDASPTMASPVPRGRHPRHRSSPRGLPALDVKQRAQLAILVVIWGIVVANFWLYWFRIDGIQIPALFWMTTAALFYGSTFLPSAYLFLLTRMRVPEPVTAPPGLRVAMVTLCVPSKESLTVIERQLQHMSAVRYPHDSWLLDEEDSAPVRRLCRQYGVRHFTRLNIPRWNKDIPPFQKRTKAGNVNAWLFDFGPDYEFFVQLDIDHNPRPEYLDRVLGHFGDPSVAWVQAPSVYGNRENWIARGSAEQELVLQGPMQMGFYGFSGTPFIIGSHTTYRTQAMIEIGGMQPTRAEDHLDTVVLAQEGYVGVYVPTIIATGLGPESIDTYLRQQFAWAHSMIKVLLHYSPRYARHFRARTAFQFLFAQTWYPLWAVSMLFLFVLPLLLLIANRSMAYIGIADFLAGFLLLSFAEIGVRWWSRRWFQPSGLSLSWRGMVLHVARWPAVLLALAFVLLGIRRPYMITPKGGADLRGRTRRTWGVVLPYVLLLGIALGVSEWFLLRKVRGPAQGYLIFSVEDAIMMTAVLTAVIVKVVVSPGDARGIRRRRSVSRLMSVILVLMLAGLNAPVIVQSVPLVVEAASHPTDVP